MARGASEKKCGTPYIFLQPLKLATSNFVHKLGLGLSYQKMTFRTKIGGVWAREHPKKFGTPYLFLQLFKIATEKLVHNMSSGLPCQTQVLGPNEVGSEFGEYHSFPFMMMMQLCILRAIKTDRYTD